MPATIRSNNNNKYTIGAFWMQIYLWNANFLAHFDLTCWLNDLENWKIGVAIEDFYWKQFGEVIMVCWSNYCRIVVRLHDNLRYLALKLCVILMLSIDYYNQSSRLIWSDFFDLWSGLLNFWVMLHSLKSSRSCQADQNCVTDTKAFKNMTTKSSKVWMI